MILRADHVVVDGRRILDDGYVWIQAGRVVEVGQGAASLRRARERAGGGEAPRDLGRAVLFPGLVNAHVHLELSGMEGSLPRGQGFVPWLQGMIPTRAAMDGDALRSGVRRGIELSLAEGTTCLGDISSSGLAAPMVDPAGVRGVVFEEAIGLTEAGYRGLARGVVERALRLESGNGARVRGGISPHAPYSVAPRLLDRLSAYRRRLRLPLAMHVSESPEEIEMIRRGRGPLQELLTEIGVLPGGALPTGRSPIRHVAEHGLLEPGCLLVHMNYLEDGDLELLRSRAGRGWSIVFCPASHRFFDHAPHPLPTYLGSGFRVALGTDGLSSNDSLSMVAEMRAVAAAFPGIDPAMILAMATEAGALALGIPDAGTLIPGRRADLAARRLPGADRVTSVLETLIQGESEPILTVVGGDPVWEADAGAGSA